MSSGALSLHTSTRDREQTHGTRWDTALSFLFRAFALTPPVLWLTARGGTRLGFGIGTGTAPEGEKGVSEGKRKRFFPSHFFLTDFSPSRNSKTVPQRVFCGRRWVTRNETWHFQGYPVHFHFLFSLSLSSSPLLPPPLGFHFLTFHVAFISLWSGGLDPPPLGDAPLRWDLSTSMYEFAHWQIVGPSFSLFLIYLARGTTAAMDFACDASKRVSGMRRTVHQGAFSIQSKPPSPVGPFARPPTRLATRLAGSSRQLWALGWYGCFPICVGSGVGPRRAPSTWPCQTPVLALTCGIPSHRSGSRANASNASGSWTLRQGAIIGPWLISRNVPSFPVVG